MRLSELVILYALNSLQRTQRTPDGYEWRGVPSGAIADYIASGEVYRGPDIAADWQPSGVQVGALIRQMRRGLPFRSEPLVELDPKHPPGQRWWRLTSAGVRVLCS